VLFPLWYVLGLGAFIWIILAVPIFVHLVLAKTWRVPRGFIIWVFFLIWVALSAVEISKSANWLTYAYRTTSYLAATLAFIYLVNTGEKELPTRRIINALTVFWIVIVLGGYAAMAAPHFSFSTPTQKVLGHLASNQPSPRPSLLAACRRSAMPSPAQLPRSLTPTGGGATSPFSCRSSSSPYGRHAPAW
jgi:hypothetical protein